MLTNDVQQQHAHNDSIYDPNLSPTDKLSDAPQPPAPGIEDLRVSDLEREFNPNTE